jgi:hypothetical protein
MINKEDTAWVHLYNCLYLVSSEYDQISHLESQTFEIFDELDTTIIGGLNERALILFLDKEWIDTSTKKELENFREYLNGIDAQRWNPKDFNYYEDWTIAREWANTLLEKLNIKKNGWCSSGKVNIYTKR